MPKATTPEEISQLIGDAITSGDLEAALSLYEPQATFVMPRALGEGSVTGLAGLREAISQFLDISPKLTVNTERTVRAGDTALGYRQLDADGPRPGRTRHRHRRSLRGCRSPSAGRQLAVRDR